MQRIVRGASWGKDLGRNQYDPTRETLLELYSGHGNSEEYRDWRHLAWDAEGRAYCPRPTTEFKAECWRAGEIMRARCMATKAEGAAKSRDPDAAPPSQTDCDERGR